MRISSVIKFFCTAISLLAVSVLSSGVGVAKELTRSINSQVMPAASFAPANVQLPEENPSPIIENTPAPVLALDEAPDPLLVLEKIPKKKQPKVAYKLAKKAFKKGEMKRAKVLLKYAAEKGYLLAQSRWANMFRDGKGVKQSHAKALKWFRVVADSHDPVFRRNRKKLRATVSALVALADYSRTGVPGTSYTKNLTRSQSLYRYAATRYGHPAAQYQLGVMYLTGEGLEKNQLVGMRWLMLSSRKGFAKAQAMLGDVYLSFKDSPKHRVLGVMWHRMAEKNAAADREKKLLARSRQIFATASELERELAVNMIVKMRESSAAATR